MPEPWLSVLLPVYNGAAYLSQALESVAGEILRGESSAADSRAADGRAAASAAESGGRGGGVEIVAVDDGSTDASPAILAQYSARLPIRVLPSAPGGNWVAATNRALAAAKGEYVSVLHQDDLWRPGRLRALRAAIARESQAALFLHAAEFIDAGGRRVGRWRCPLGSGCTASRVAVERLLVQNFIAMPAPLFRRQAALACGGFDEQLRYTADWEMWLKLAARGDVVYIPRVLAAFRIHAASQTAAFPPDRFRDELETTLARHLAAYEATCCVAGSRSAAQEGRAAALARAARFSVAVNAALAARFHGHPLPLARLAAQGFRLGPGGWRRYLRDSRIAERLTARLRAGLNRRANA